MQPIAIKSTWSGSMCGKQGAPECYAGKETSILPFLFNVFYLQSAIHNCLIVIVMDQSLPAPDFLTLRLSTLETPEQWRLMSPAPYIKVKKASPLGSNMPLGTFELLIWFYLWTQKNSLPSVGRPSTDQLSLHWPPAFSPVMFPLCRGQFWLGDTQQTLQANWESLE